MRTAGKEEDMKKCLFSKYIKLSDSDMDLVKQDIEKFNTMKRKAFVMIREMDGDLPIPPFSRFNSYTEERSIHLLLKDVVNCNDYFRNSAREEAKAAYKSALELMKLNEEELKSKISQIDKKISDNERLLKNLLKEKESLIKRSKLKKSGSKRKAGFASYRGGREKEISDNVFTVRTNHKEIVYPNAYLFEVQYLDPKIRKIKSRIRNIKNRREKCIIKLNKLHKRSEDKDVSVCFGSKALFKKQNTVYDDHKEWLKVFRKNRNKGMTVSGRSDAVQGNFVFRYDSMNHTLRYKSMSGKEILLNNVVFPYGQKYVDYAVNLRENRKAVAWRLEISGNKILVKCMVELPEKEMNYYTESGCIGIDMNTDNISVAETDKYGNLIYHKVIRFNLENKSSGLREQILSAALEEAFTRAKTVHKPIIMERIKGLHNEALYKNKQLNRKIESFAYDNITKLASSKSYKYGIKVYTVNPAFTSQIGKIKYMRHHGLSIHEAAAYTIARRGMNYKEKVPNDLKHLVPEENRKRHHWSHWRFLSRHLKKQIYYKFYNYIPYKSFENIRIMNKYFGT